MKITMMKILRMREDLDALFRKDIPIAASWKISKFIRQVENEYEDFERNRMRILDKYFDKELGSVPDNQKEILENEMGNLLNVETELNIDPIDISELGNISVPPLALAKMSFLFKEPEQESLADLPADKE